MHSVATEGWYLVFDLFALWVCRLAIFSRFADDESATPWIFYDGISAIVLHCLRSLFFAREAEDAFGAFTAVVIFYSLTILFW